MRTTYSIRAFKKSKLFIFGIVFIARKNNTQNINDKTADNKDCCQFD